MAGPPPRDASVSGACSHGKRYPRAANRRVMSRTIRDLPVPGRTILAVRAHLLQWLRSKEFLLIDVDSEGSAVRFPFGIISLLLHPVPGDSVALRPRASGAIAMEYRFFTKDDRTVVHVEAYAAGAGPWSGHEWALSEEWHFMAGYPRHQGFQVLQELEQDLREFADATNAPTTSSLPNGAMPAGSTAPGDH